MKTQKTDNPDRRFTFPKLKRTDNPSKDQSVKAPKSKSTYPRG